MLRRELSQYKARIEELEQDFLKFDVLGPLEASSHDDQLHKAWEVAATFKKRWGGGVGREDASAAMCL